MAISVGSSGSGETKILCLPLSEEIPRQRLARAAWLSARQARHPLRPSISLSLLAPGYSASTYTYSSTAAQSGAEAEESGGKKRRMAEEKKARREEELLEAALAAAAAALFVSGVKKLMPVVFVAQWPAALLATAPSPVLFLVLNVIIASIVAVSVQPRRAASGVVQAAPGEGTKKVRRRRSKRRGEGAEPAAPETVAAGAADCCMALVVKDGVEMAAAEQEEEVASNAAEEVNKRAEEFISAFRHHLRVDSSSGSRRGSARIAPCF